MPTGAKGNNGQENQFIVCNVIWPQKTLVQFKAVYTNTSCQSKEGQVLLYMALCAFVVI